MPLPAREALQRLDDLELAELLFTACQGALRQATEHFLSSRGVTCFSETNDNLLMWSHYGERGQGMCLQFDTSFEPFSKVMPVEYAAEIPGLDVTADLLRGAYDDIMRLYCTKSVHWSYEREWRGIHNERDTAFHYESACLTGVYFGPDTPEDLVEITCLILRGQNKAVRTYRGARSSDSFDVKFVEFEYHSHLEAKDLGLYER